MYSSHDTHNCLKVNVLVTQYTHNCLKVNVLVTQYVQHFKWLLKVHQMTIKPVQQDVPGTGHTLMHTSYAVLTLSGRVGSSDMGDISHRQSKADDRDAMRDYFFVPIHTTPVQTHHIHTHIQTYACNTPPTPYIF